MRKDVECQIPAAAVADGKCIIASYFIEGNAYKKLLQWCSNISLRPELEPIIIACLAGRDAQEVLYTGFV